MLYREHILYRTLSGAEHSTIASEGREEAGSVGEVREFRCHRVVFASCSEYFRVLLYGPMSESHTRRVELSDVDVEGFEAILSYAYTGRVAVTTGNLEGDRAAVNT